MYCKHFGFERFPFSVTSDPQFFYVSTANAEVLSALALEVKRGSGFVVVTGEAGVGKTTLLRKLSVDLPGCVRCAFVIAKARLSFVALLRSILTELGVFTLATDRDSLLEQLRNYPGAQASKGCSVALICDEAQAMSDEELMQVSALCDSGAAMSIVFAGQSDLESRLNQRKLHSLKEQITAMLRLPRLRNAEVESYVTSRLEHAGLVENALFEPQAIEKIVKWSSGIPRLVNMISDNALLLAYRASATTVTAQMIEQAVSRLRLDERLTEVARRSPAEIVPALDDATMIANSETADRGRPVPAQQARKSQRQKNHFVNLSQFRLAGALGMGVASALGFATFHSLQHDTPVSRAAMDLETSGRAPLAIHAAVEPLRAENMSVAAQTQQPAPTVLPASAAVHQEGIQNDAAVAKQDHADVAKADKPSHVPLEQIYRVVGASFVRSRPAANADIIETLQPGIRVAILSRAGEFIRVRSLDNAAVLGFVHREDAFFERIQ